MAAARLVKETKHITITLEDYIKEEKDFFVKFDEKIKESQRKRFKEKLLSKVTSGYGEEVLIDALEEGPGGLPNDPDSEDDEDGFGGEKPQFKYSMLLLAAPISTAHIPLGNMILNSPDQKRFPSLTDSIHPDEPISLKRVLEETDKLPGRIVEREGKVKKEDLVYSSQKYPNIFNEVIASRNHAFQVFLDSEESKKLKQGNLSFNYEEENDLGSYSYMFWGISYYQSIEQDGVIRTKQYQRMREIFPSKAIAKKEEVFERVWFVMNREEIQDAIKKFAKYARNSAKCYIVFNGHGLRDSIAILEEEKIPNEALLLDVLDFEDHINRSPYPDTIEYVAAHCHSSKGPKEPEEVKPGKMLCTKVTNLQVSPTNTKTEYKFTTRPLIGSEDAKTMVCHFFDVKEVDIVRAKRSEDKKNIEECVIKHIQLDKWAEDKDCDELLTIWIREETLKDKEKCKMEIEHAMVSMVITPFSVNDYVCRVEFEGPGCSQGTATLQIIDSPSDGDMPEQLPATNPDN